MNKQIIFLFSLTIQGYCDLILKNHEKNETFVFEDAEATFGTEITDNLPWGNISEASPKLACGEVKPPPSSGVYFALADRGNCSFLDKALSIQNAYYQGAIIINTQSDYVFPMSPDKDINISIPLIMVGRTTGLKIRNQYLYNYGFMAKIAPNEGNALEYYLVPLLIIFSLAFLGLIIFLSFRAIRNCLRQSKNRLSRDVLKKLPEIRFSEEYQNQYETCAICLEDYALGEKLRVLPCNHAYHSKCVDRWLLRRQRNCPVCKYRIHRGRGSTDSDEDQPAGADGPSTSRSRRVDGGEQIGSRAPAPPTARLGHPPSVGSNVSLEYQNDEDDVAPLLSRSAPNTSTWLSGGQLPNQANNAWLGYDNRGVENEDEDDELIDRLSSKQHEDAQQQQQENESGVSHQIPEVSILDPSSSTQVLTSASSEPSNAETVINVKTESPSPNDRKSDEHTEEKAVGEQDSPLVNV